jgi:hypothetical protein
LALALAACALLLATAVGTRTARAGDVPVFATPTPVPTIIPPPLAPAPPATTAPPAAPETTAPSAAPTTTAPPAAPDTAAPAIAAPATAAPATAAPASAAPDATAPAAAPDTTAPPTPAPIQTGLVYPLPGSGATKQPVILPQRERVDPGNQLYAPLRYFANTKWSCETFSGYSVTRFSVKRGPYYGFTLRTIARLPVGGFEPDETYAYDWPHHAWKAAFGPGPYRLRSVRLDDNDWIFDGTEVTLGRSRPFRVRYHMYDDVIFRRDFETLRNGVWLPYAGETCERNDFADMKM